MDRVAATGDGEVGADAVGDEALVEHLARDVEAEVEPTVGGVQPDAAVLELSGLGDEDAVGVQHAARVGREQVGDDIAGLEQGQQFTNHVRAIAFFGIADVDHQWYVAFARRAFGQTRHLHAQDLQRGRDHARLDAPDETLVRVDGTQGRIEVDAGRGDDVGRGRQAGLADMQKGQDFGFGLGQDVFGKSAEGSRARATRVDDRGHASAHAGEVGVDAVVGHTVEDMRVQIDQSGGDGPALHVDDPVRLPREYVWCDLGDLAIVDRHVQWTVQCLRRIDDGSTAENQVVHSNIAS